MCLKCTQDTFSLIIKMDCDAFIKTILARVAVDFPPRKVKKTKTKNKCIPVHNHPLSTEIHTHCPLCQSHGNIMVLRNIEYEIV